MFEEFQLGYDLWTKLSDQRKGASVRHTRRQLRQQESAFEAARIKKKEKEEAEKAEAAAKEATSKRTPAKAKTQSRRQSARVSAATETRAPSKRKSTGGSSRRRSSRQAAQEVEHEEDEGEDEDDEEGNESEEIETGTQTPEDLSEVFKGRRLKLKYTLPKTVITHPSHHVEPEHGGLDAYLKSFVLLDNEVSIEERDAYVEEQVDLRNRIDEAREQGLLAEWETAEENLEPFRDPERSLTHRDYMNAQASHFARLLMDERRAHVSGARRIAKLVGQYFRSLEGADEKERKLHEKTMRQLARRTATDVLKKWKLAEKVVQQRRQRAQEEEQREKGKLHLNRILEKSAKLLEARIDGGRADDDAVDSDDDVSDTDANVSHDDESVGGSESSLESASENFSSESDSEDEEEDAANEDDKLTVDELRQKYAKLDSADIESTAEPEESDRDVDGEAETTQVENGVAKVEDDDVDVAEPTEEALRLYNEARDSDDESDESVSMGSESEDESEAESEEESDGEPVSSLAMLYGGGGGGAVDYDDEDDDEDAQVSDASDVESDKAEREQSSPVEAPVEAAVEAAVEAPNGHAAAEASVEAKEEDAAMVKIEGEKSTPGPAENGLAHKHKIAQPFLLRGQLREYQHDGLDWLAGLYNGETNGILADEMGLGKTIQTIALLSYLACEKERWGPHLIVVPTSVMLNWEMEFKRFAPAFKVLTYYGNPQQRKEKRRGWNKEDTFHVCITSYQLVLQDNHAFRRKKWLYMILDEAHNIKNFRSQRWQALLNFNAERRLLLTGTPLQNNLVELWSLLYFLMPSSKGSQILPDGFANLQDFQDWFARPVDKLVEGSSEVDDEARATVNKLHQVLRPYLLRRLKADVEKQMPAKYEHIVYCRLSKRQRYLYDDFMSRAQTRETLASGNFLSIINCLMQLRKVCNHPDLFEVRPIVTSLAVQRSVITSFLPTVDKVSRMATMDARDSEVDLPVLNLALPDAEAMTTHEAASLCRIRAHKQLGHSIAELAVITPPTETDYASLDQHSKFVQYQQRTELADQLRHKLYLNVFRCARRPMYGRNVRDACSIVSREPEAGYDWSDIRPLNTLRKSYRDHERQLAEVVQRYSFVTPSVVCLNMPALTLGPVATSGVLEPLRSDDFLHLEQVKSSIAFPDKRLLQYDCGKLQRLAVLLRDLIDGGHRALIFTQMTRVLDVLEQFLNIHGWRYLRLDGATKVEQRQFLTERFNSDAKIPVFILSTRSGGLGINLTGADTVIFYDSDWNPSMDKQCQDRCHRIGQTRDVHIYRFVSEHTIESNILRKATQKQILDNVVIQEGDFTTDYFHRLTVQDMIGNVEGISTDRALTENLPHNLQKALAVAEDAEDAAAANVAIKEANLDNEEFAERASSVPLSTAGESYSQSPAPTSGADAGSVFTELEPTASPAVLPSDDDEPGHIDDYMIRFIENGYFYD